MIQNHKNVISHVLMYFLLEQEVGVGHFIEIGLKYHTTLTK